MHVSMWFKFSGGLFQRQNPWYLRGKRDNKEDDLNYAHPFPRVSWYKKGSDITKAMVYVDD